MKKIHNYELLQHYTYPEQNSVNSNSVYFTCIIYVYFPVYFSNMPCGVNEAMTLMERFVAVDIFSETKQSTNRSNLCLRLIYLDLTSEKFRQER